MEQDPVIPLPYAPPVKRTLAAAEPRTHDVFRLTDVFGPSAESGDVCDIDWSFLDADLDDFEEATAPSRPFEPLLVAPKGYTAQHILGPGAPPIRRYEEDPEVALWRETLPSDPLEAPAHGYPNTDTAAVSPWIRQWQAACFSPVRTEVDRTRRRLALNEVLRDFVRATLPVAVHLIETRTTAGLCFATEQPEPPAGGDGFEPRETKPPGRVKAGRRGKPVPPPDAEALAAAHLQTAYTGKLPLNVAGGAPGTVSVADVYYSFALSPDRMRYFADPVHALKGVAHKKKGLDALLQCGVEGVGPYPYYAATYLGHRVLIAPKLPVGMEVEADTSCEAAALVGRCADALNLKPHWAGGGDPAGTSLPGLTSTMLSASFLEASNLFDSSFTSSATPFNPPEAYTPQAGQIGLPTDAPVSQPQDDGLPPETPEPPPSGALGAPLPRPESRGNGSPVEGESLPKPAEERGEQPPAGDGEAGAGYRTPNRSPRSPAAQAVAGGKQAGRDRRPAGTGVAVVVGTPRATGPADGGSGEHDDAGAEREPPSRNDLGVPANVQVTQLVTSSSETRRNDVGAKRDSPSHNDLGILETARVAQLITRSNKTGRNDASEKRESPSHNDLGTPAVAQSAQLMTRSLASNGGHGRNDAGATRDSPARNAREARASVQITRLIARSRASDGNGEGAVSGARKPPDSEPSEGGTEEAVNAVHHPEPGARELPGSDVLEATPTGAASAKLATVSGLPVGEKKGGQSALAQRAAPLKVETGASVAPVDEVKDRQDALAEKAAPLKLVTGASVVRVDEETDGQNALAQKAAALELVTGASVVPVDEVKSGQNAQRRGEQGRAAEPQPKQAGRAARSRADGLRLQEGAPGGGRTRREYGYEAQGHAPPKRLHAGPATLRARLGKRDRRLYFIGGTARVFPAVPPDNDAAPQGHLYRLLRREAVGCAVTRKLRRMPLSSDAFTPFGKHRGDEQDTEVALWADLVATGMLHAAVNVMVSASFSNGVAAPLPPGYWLTDTNPPRLSTILHERGVNVRLLGHLHSILHKRMSRIVAVDASPFEYDDKSRRPAEHGVKSLAYLPHLRALVAAVRTEMVARVVKDIVHGSLRKGGVGLMEVFTHIFDSSHDTTLQGEDVRIAFWFEVLVPRIEEKFGSCQGADVASYFFTLEDVSKEAMFTRIRQLTGVVLCQNGVRLKEFCNRRALAKKTDAVKAFPLLDLAALPATPYLDGEVNHLSTRAFRLVRSVAGNEKLQQAPNDISSLHREATAAAVDYLLSTGVGAEDPDVASCSRWAARDSPSPLMSSFKPLTSFATGPVFSSDTFSGTSHGHMFSASDSETCGAHVLSDSPTLQQNAGTLMYITKRKPEIVVPFEVVASDLPTKGTKVCWGVSSGDEVVMTKGRFKGVEAVVVGEGNGWLWRQHSGEALGAVAFNARSSAELMQRYGVQIVGSVRVETLKAGFQSMRRKKQRSQLSDAAAVAMATAARDLSWEQGAELFEYIAGTEAAKFCVSAQSLQGFGVSRQETVLISKGTDHHGAVGVVLGKSRTGQLWILDVATGVSFPLGGGGERPADTAQKHGLVNLSVDLALSPMFERHLSLVTLDAEKTRVLDDSDTFPGDGRLKEPADNAGVPEPSAKRTEGYYDATAKALGRLRVYPRQEFLVGAGRHFLSPASVLGVDVNGRLCVKLTASGRVVSYPCKTAADVAVNINPLTTHFRTPTEPPRPVRHDRPNFSSLPFRSWSGEPLVLDGRTSKMMLHANVLFGQPICILKGRWLHRRGVALGVRRAVHSDEVCIWGTIEGYTGAVSLEGCCFESTGEAVVPVLLREGTLLYDVGSDEAKPENADQNLSRKCKTAAGTPIAGTPPTHNPGRPVTERVHSVGNHEHNEEHQSSLRNEEPMRVLTAARPAAQHAGGAPVARAQFRFLAFFGEIVAFDASPSMLLPFRLLHGQVIQYGSGHAASRKGVVIGVWRDEVWVCPSGCRQAIPLPGTSYEEVSRTYTIKVIGFTSSLSEILDVHLPPAARCRPKASGASATGRRRRLPGVHSTFTSSFELVGLDCTDSEMAIVSHFRAGDLVEYPGGFRSSAVRSKAEPPDVGMAVRYEWEKMMSSAVAVGVTRSPSLLWVQVVGARGVVGLLPSQVQGLKKIGNVGRNAVKEEFEEDRLEWLQATEVASRDASSIADEDGVQSYGCIRVVHGVPGLTNLEDATHRKGSDRSSVAERSNTRYSSCVSPNRFGTTTRRETSSAKGDCDHSPHPEVDDRIAGKIQRRNPRIPLVQAASELEEEGRGMAGAASRRLIHLPPANSLAGGTVCDGALKPYLSLVKPGDLSFLAQCFSAYPHHLVRRALDAALRVHGASLSYSDDEMTALRKLAVIATVHGLEVRLPRASELAAVKAKAPEGFEERLAVKLRAMQITDDAHSAVAESDRIARVAGWETAKEALIKRHVEAGDYEAARKARLPRNSLITMSRRLPRLMESAPGSAADQFSTEKTALPCIAPPPRVPPRAKDKETAASSKRRPFLAACSNFPAEPYPAGLSAALPFALAAPLPAARGGSGYLRSTGEEVHFETDAAALEAAWGPGTRAGAVLRCGRDDAAGKLVVIVGQHAGRLWRCDCAADSRPGPAVPFVARSADELRRVHNLTPAALPRGSIAQGRPPGLVRTSNATECRVPSADPFVFPLWDGTPAVFDISFEACAAFGVCHGDRYACSAETAPPLFEGLSAALPDVTARGIFPLVLTVIGVRDGALHYAVNDGSGALKHEDPPDFVASGPSAGFVESFALERLYAGPVRQGAPGGKRVKGLLSERGLPPGSAYPNSVFDRATADPPAPARTRRKSRYLFPRGGDDLFSHCHPRGYGAAAEKWGGVLVDTTKAAFGQLGLECSPGDVVILDCLPGDDDEVTTCTVIGTARFALWVYIDGSEGATTLSLADYRAAAPGSPLSGKAQKRLLSVFLRAVPSPLGQSGLRYPTTAGNIVDFKVAERLLEPFGLRHGDVIRTATSTVRNTAVVIGVRQGVLWRHVDGDSGASPFLGASNAKDLLLFGVERTGETRVVEPFTG
ncbi:putative E3 ubiquitin-protein ligase HERC2 [Diplonema papillatum]|nr:putative E3 ubiquitin-protein ligase HERC2 [Diplonema papillatum]